MVAAMDTATLRHSQETASRDFARVERAIRFLERNFRDQPDLDAVAQAANLSPYHFQRLFTRWAGISPKQFLRFVTVGHAKDLLGDGQSVLDATLDSGLSGPGRLHDLFCVLEAMTPGEYKAMGAGLAIDCGTHHGPFGDFLLAVTERGICGLSFLGEGGRAAALDEVAARWPGATVRDDPARTAGLAEAIFAGAGTARRSPIRLWCRGTNFQLKVWQALLSLPQGRVTSYGALAQAIGHERSARAVGGALAANAIGYLIPCHRVIRSSASFETGYRWGSARKRAMLAWEAARSEGATAG